MKKYLLFLVLFLCFSAGQAAEYSVDATIEQDAFYDDNVRLSEDPEGSLGYTLTPTIYFSRNTENLQINADASYGIQRYLDIENLDQEFQRYGLQTDYTTERSRLGIDADLSILPLRSNAEEDSGDFGTTAETTTWSVAPSYSYQITELDELILSGEHSDTSISSSDSNSGSVNDYTDQIINFDWQRQWTERYSTRVGIFYSRFKSMPSSNLGTKTTSDSYGINFSTAFIFLKNWEFEGTIGGRITESENTTEMFDNPLMPMAIIKTTEKDSSMGFLSDITVNYKGERLVSSIYWKSSLTPSTQGQLNEQNTVGLNLAYQLTERLDANIETRYIVTEAASTDDSVERKNLHIEPYLSWQMAPDWTLVGAYRYRLQDTDSSVLNRSVDSNSFTLSINYHWPGLSISR